MKLTIPPILFSLVCLYSYCDISKTHTAESASYDDVKAAIARAMPGETVHIPEGVATWHSQLVITKGIKLIGAGPDKTIITGAYNAPNMSNPSDPVNYLIVYSPTSPEANESFRLSGFTIDAGIRSIPFILYNNTVSAITNVRIDHNKIINCMPGRLFLVYGTVYGVIDSNEFHGGTMRFYALNARTWNNLTFDFGSADNIYVEDNVFYHSTTSVSSGAGSRACIRHNTFYYSGDNALSPWFDIHGNQGPGTNLSGMGLEVYRNVIHAGSKSVKTVNIRGGKCLVYDNVVNTTTSCMLTIDEENNDNENPPAISPISGQTQHVSDTYIWGNRKNGIEFIPTEIGQTEDYGGTIGIVPQENREFWQENMTFDGTSGVGVGPMATRPSTCTKGVAYWATDRNILYRGTATNTWEAYYTPYAYPHPLRGTLR